MRNLLQTIFEKIKEIKNIHTNLKENHAHKTMVSNECRENICKQTVEIDIPTNVIIKVVIIVALLFIAGELVIELKNILTVSIICFFLAIGLTPIVQNLEQRKIPRSVSILLLYIGFLSILTIVFFAIIPVFIEQLAPIYKNFSDFFGNNLIINAKTKAIFEQIESIDISNLFQGELPVIAEKVQEYFQTIFSGTISILSSIFQGIFNVIYALVLLFFILLERETLSNTVLNFFPKNQKEYIVLKTKKVQLKMASWFRGQFILMISVGTFMYIGMKIFEYTLGMQYALAIGLLAGFMEIFPYIGVFITGIFTVLIAYNISWTLVIAVIIWIGLTQFLEGNILVPIVMEKVTGLSSVTVILALSVGGILGNAGGGFPLAILGMILAIPLAASIAIMLEDYTNKTKD